MISQTLDTWGTRSLHESYDTTFMSFPGIDCIACRLSLVELHADIIHMHVAVLNQAHPLISVEVDRQNVKCIHSMEMDGIWGRLTDWY